VSAEVRNKVVVLDRDGTIVIDREYLADPAGLEFLPGAAEGLRRLHQRGYRLVVISNQSGVGRGLFSQRRLDEINRRLLQMVHSAGAEIAGIYCCPHRPDENCDCRKPQVRLLQDAARELGFEARATIVVGDQASDIELGWRVGATTVLIADAPLKDRGTAPCADFVAGDLLQAAVIIEGLE